MARKFQVDNFLWKSYSKVESSMIIGHSERGTHVHCISYTDKRT